MNTLHTAASVPTAGTPSEAVRAVHAVTDAEAPDILDQAGDADLSYILLDTDGDGKVDHLLFSTGDGQFRLEVLDDEYEARAS